ncbi:MAG: SIS domain-containing protein [Thermosynechococcaceae cyanobacterium MS004]|nr:SIS domain-containing protein [Thermosynechococcaceae cyanobacterium MS004]
MSNLDKTHPENTYPKNTYLDNILEQPDVLRSITQLYQDSDVWEAIHQAWSSRSQYRLVLTGLGASFNALYPARYYLHQQGLPALHIDTGELIHYLPELLQQPLFLVVVSQSGESIEIQRLLEQIAQQRSAGSPHWLVSITNQSGNRLAQASDLALYTQAGREVGVATKTYTSTLAVLHWLARAIAGQPLHAQEILQVADHCDLFLADWQVTIQPAFSAAKDAASFALVARGPSIASACNGALGLQEAARCPASGYVGSQFRHGPMEMISPALATLLWTLPDQTFDLSARMAKDIGDRGGCLVTMGAAVPGLDNAHISLPRLSSWLSPILDILPVQLLIAELAEAQGIIPGQFRWSGKVIHQE